MVIKTFIHPIIIGRHDLFGNISSYILKSVCRWIIFNLKPSILNREPLGFSYCKKANILLEHLNNPARLDTHLTLCPIKTLSDD